MRTCRTCFFFSVLPPNKNGDAFCRCKRYEEEKGINLLFSGQILNVEKMIVTDGLVDAPGTLGTNTFCGNRQVSGKNCTDWVSVEEQEIVNKGW